MRGIGQRERSDRVLLEGRGVVVRTSSDIAAALDDPHRKQSAVDWIFGTVAQRYDFGNDLMSLGWHKRWKKRLVASVELAPGVRVLDLATGTGDVAWLIGARMTEGSVVGVDIHPDMLALAESKRTSIPIEVGFQVGDAGDLPFADASFDVVTCSYAGRGFPSWPRVVSEIHRVLAPGGTFYNLDFARPRPHAWDVMVRGWMFVSGALLGLLLHGHASAYTYIPQTLSRYPGQRWLAGVLEAQGFVQVQVEETIGVLMAFHRAKKQ